MHRFQKDSKVITYCISTNTKRHILNPNAYEFTMRQSRAGAEEIRFGYISIRFQNKGVAFEYYTFIYYMYEV